MLYGFLSCHDHAWMQKELKGYIEEQVRTYGSMAFKEHRRAIAVRVARKLDTTEAEVEEVCSHGLHGYGNAPNYQAQLFEVTHCSG